MFGFELALPMVGIATQLTQREQDMHGATVNRWRPFA
jgi:hypothetical protein